jgi:hypothetical protein
MDERDLIDAGLIYPSDGKIRRLLLMLAARMGMEAGYI